MTQLQQPQQPAATADAACGPDHDDVHAYAETAAVVVGTERLTIGVHELCPCCCCSCSYSDAPGGTGGEDEPGTTTTADSTVVKQWPEQSATVLAWEEARRVNDDLTARIEAQDAALASAAFEAADLRRRMAEMETQHRRELAELRCAKETAEARAAAAAVKRQSAERRADDAEALVSGLSTAAKEHIASLAAAQKQVTTLQTVNLRMKAALAETKTERRRERRALCHTLAAAVGTLDISAAAFLLIARMHDTMCKLHKFIIKTMRLQARDPAAAAAFCSDQTLQIVITMADLLRTRIQRCMHRVAKVATVDDFFMREGMPIWHYDSSTAATVMLAYIPADAPAELQEVKRWITDINFAAECVGTKIIECGFPARMALVAGMLAPTLHATEFVQTFCRDAKAGEAAAAAAATTDPHDDASAVGSDAEMANVLEKLVAACPDLTLMAQYLNATERSMKEYDTAAVIATRTKMHAWVDKLRGATHAAGGDGFVVPEVLDQ